MAEPEPEVLRQVLAFDRLVGRVLDGRVVPFVGAGISREARVEGDNFIPEVWALQKKLGAELRRAAKDVQVPSLKVTLEALLATDCWACKKSRDGDIWKKIEPCPKCAERVKEWEPKLDQGADLVTWLFGAAHLCRVLEVEKFTRLSVLPAHRFLAYFAREGLISEIITTNYDTCIERAYNSSFGCLDAPDDALAVIWSLPLYRKHAGRNKTGSGDPVLHLYKINGDAEDYVDALWDYERDQDPDRLDKRAARIIVTERQLQTFRDELWARDLFADRARSRSLLFCGFGSDEPQVRHHAMSLMEEMQRQSKPSPEWSTVSDLPNAPFLSVHGGSLSFPQLQIMVGFASAHVRPSMPPNGDLTMKIAFENVFLGPFAIFLGASKEALAADIFFQKLFQAVWLRRLSQELSAGKPLHTWLRSLVRAPDAWLDNLRHTLGAGLHISPDEDTYKALFGETDALFKIEPGPDAEPVPIPLMRWLHAVCTGGADIAFDQDFYLPLRDEPLLTLVTLLFITWIHPNDPWNHVSPASGLGLRVSLGSESDGGAAPVKEVYLVQEGIDVDPNLWHGKGGNLCWMIEIPGNNTLNKRDRPPVPAGDPIRPVKLIYRSAAEIVRRATGPQANPYHVLTEVFSNPSKEES